MGVRDIAHKPELTRETVEDIFRRHFEPKHLEIGMAETGGETQNRGR